MFISPGVAAERRFGVEPFTRLDSETNSLSMEYNTNSNGILNLNSALMKLMA